MGKASRIKDASISPFSAVILCVCRQVATLPASHKAICRVQRQLEVGCERRHQVVAYSNGRQDDDLPGCRPTRVGLPILHTHCDALVVRCSIVAIGVKPFGERELHIRYGALFGELLRTKLRCI